MKFSIIFFLLIQCAAFAKPTIKNKPQRDIASFKSLSSSLEEIKRCKNIPGQDEDAFRNCVLKFFEDGSDIKDRVSISLAFMHYSKSIQKLRECYPPEKEFAALAPRNPNYLMCFNVIDKLDGSRSGFLFSNDGIRIHSIRVF